MNLKKYLPYENYILTSSINKEEIISRLQENISIKYHTAFQKKQNTICEKPYEGTINENNFLIHRVIDYRNSFLPIISGEITSKLTGSEIHIKMQLNKFTRIFISLWLGIIFLVCIGMTVALIVNFSKIANQEFRLAGLIPFGMLVFGLLLTILGFKTESAKSKIFLEELLEGKEKSN